MDEQRLVNSLINAFKKHGFEILRAVGGNYQEPYKIGRHEPDIIARDPESGLIIIGEAKTAEGLSSAYTKEQLLDFARRVMAEGLSRGKRVPLHIIVPKTELGKVNDLLTELGLKQEIGQNIILWYEE